MRAAAIGAAVDHVSVAGFQISVGSTPLVTISWSLVCSPPTASTSPLASIVSVWYTRALCIGAICRHFGLASVRSIVEVPAVALVVAVTLGAPPL